MRMRTKIANFTLIALTFLVSASLSQESDDETIAARALRKDSSLRARLDTPVFRELKEGLPHGTVNGKTFWYAEGDLALDEDELLFYAKQRENQRITFALGTSTNVGDQLISMKVNGKIVRWAPGSTVKYCILKSTFDDQEFSGVVANMNAATRDWMQACGVKLQHVPALDDSPATGVPQGVTFAVAKVDLPGGTIAQSFFPPDPRSRHFLFIDPVYFGSDLTFDKVGVLRHELGHVLGYRHEHIRTEAPPACRGETVGEVFELTNYDPRSVMHYFCGGFGTSALAISTLDRQGSQRVYGGPGGVNPPIPATDDPSFLNFHP
jgi:hypothetical protein